MPILRWGLLGVMIVALAATVAMAEELSSSSPSSSQAIRVVAEAASVGVEDAKVDTVVPAQEVASASSSVSSALAASASSSNVVASEGDKATTGELFKRLANRLGVAAREEVQKIKTEVANATHTFAKEHKSEFDALKKSLADNSAKATARISNDTAQIRDEVASALDNTHLSNVVAAVHDSIKNKLAARLSAAQDQARRSRADAKLQVELAADLGHGVRGEVEFQVPPALLKHIAAANAAARDRDVAVVEEDVEEWAAREMNNLAQAVHRDKELLQDEERAIMEARTSALSKGHPFGVAVDDLEAKLAAELTAARQGVRGARADGADFARRMGMLVPHFAGRRRRPGMHFIGKPDAARSPFGHPFVGRPYGGVRSPMLPPPGARRGPVPPALEDFHKEMTAMLQGAARGGPTVKSDVGENAVVSKSVSKTTITRAGPDGVHVQIQYGVPEQP